MNNPATISVVMSTAHESAHLVRQAVESILQQTLLPHEFIIVVDDSSNSDVLEYLQKVTKTTALVTVSYHTEQQGLAVCRNEGVQKASGEYIALMDADDIALPYRLKIQLDYLQSRALDGVFAQVQHIDEAGEGVGYFHPTSTNPKRDIFLRHIFVHPTAFLKKSVFATEQYDPAFFRAQDIDLWIRLLQAGKNFEIVPEVLLQYRVHRVSPVADRLKRQAGYAQYGFKIVQKHFVSNVGNPFFWYFTLKWSFYNLLLNHTPKRVLVGLVHMKDVMRKHKE